MDPYSSPYIILNKSLHNPFPHSLLRIRQWYSRWVPGVALGLVNTIGRRLVSPCSCRRGSIPLRRVLVRRMSPAGMPVHCQLIISDPDKSPARFVFTIQPMLQIQNQATANTEKASPRSGGRTLCITEGVVCQAQSSRSESAWPQGGQPPLQEDSCKTLLKPFSDLGNPCQALKNPNVSS